MKNNNEKGFQKKRSCILVYSLRTGLEERQEPERQTNRPCLVDLVQACFHLKS